MRIFCFALLTMFSSLCNAAEASRQMATHLKIRFNMDSDSSEPVCLAKNIFFESRDQGIKGMYAVASVTLNRVRDSRWPNTICGVVKQRKLRNKWICQFSWFCDGKSDKPNLNIRIERNAWDMSKLIASIFLSYNVPDTTGGAMWYHADFVAPTWANSYVVTTQINNHIFYQDTQ